MSKEGNSLTKLGAGRTEYKLDGPSADILETFENRYPGREYNIEFVFPEFTSLCPKTGQPDFATIIINYTPSKLCIESKSLKLYFFSYRNYGSFMESITNKILDDLAKVCSPIRMQVEGCFNARGGTHIKVKVSYIGKRKFEEEL